MSNNQPLVSVLIPTYNMARTLGACLDSVLSQDYPAFEIIVSDNYSTDSSAEILDRFLPQQNLKVVRPPRHVPMYGNFNWSLRSAQGRIIKFLCADDVLLPGALSCIVAHFQKYPEVGVLQFGGPFLNEDGRRMGPYGHNRNIRMGLWSGAKLALAQVPSMDLATPSHTAFRRRVLEQVLLNGTDVFDASMIQADWDLLLRLFSRCDVFRIPGQLVAYRVGGYHRQVSDSTWALSDALRIAERYYGHSSTANGHGGQCKRMIQNDVSERFVWWIMKKFACCELRLATKALKILSRHNLVFWAGLNALCRSPLYLSQKIIRTN
ncbi:MAG: glycosyltransferase [Actinobacteria bacterium]|nr:glycosyltransferase [Actinomycetota bacterium]